MLRLGNHRGPSEYGADTRRKNPRRDIAGRGETLVPKKKKPPSPLGWRVSVKAPGSDLLLHGLSHTTIGAGAFHFRVRDGIGWDHTAMAARESVGRRWKAPARVGNPGRVFKYLGLERRDAC